MSLAETRLAESGAAPPGEPVTVPHRTAPYRTAPGVEPHPHVEQRYLVNVYVWELPVRLAHWLIVGSMILLSVTGIYIGRPFLASPPESANAFYMGTAKAIHFWSAWVLIGALVMRIVWMFTGNKYARWDKFVPVREHRWRGILPTLKFYLFARRKPPGFIGHNPVAGIAYTLVLLLLATEVLTGLALWGMSAAVGSPIRVFAGLLPLLGGAQTARFVHHLVMWFLWGFAAHHVWSGILMSSEEANATMESIFSGHKFVEPEDLVYSGYRFKPRAEIPEDILEEWDRREAES
jgi:Ni/Fe-hydrogenase 1 B-type cytochrome subunit